MLNLSPPAMSHDSTNYCVPAMYTHVNVSKIKMKNTPNKPKNIIEIEFILKKKELLSSENASNVVVCVLTGGVGDKPTPGLDQNEASDQTEVGESRGARDGLRRGRPLQHSGLLPPLRAARGRGAMARDGGAHSKPSLERGPVTGIEQQVWG